MTEELRASDVARGMARPDNPLVVLVGRPNVGKSTLFNRILGQRLAIVDDEPGTTRDRLVADSEWAGRSFQVVDTGGMDPYVFSGQSPLSVGSKDYIDAIREQVQVAVDMADLVLFLVDVQSGVTPADEEVATFLRKRQRTAQGEPFPPVLLVANKADNPRYEGEAEQFYELGMGDPIVVSAYHGLGTGELLDRVVANLPASGGREEDENLTRIAIAGRPNVGKSSLVNRLLGEERTIVSPVPGTTRDAIDSYVEFEGQPLVLVDTAGIRRRGKVSPGVEKYSVLRALMSIERSDIALLVLDAVEGVTEQDAHVAGMILDAGKSAVILVNKWDAVEKDEHTTEVFTQRVRENLSFMDFAPLLFISAKTGYHVDRVLPLTLDVSEQRRQTVPTPELNRIFRAAEDEHPPASRARRVFHIYNAQQVATAPPIIELRVRNADLAHFSYLRYLENRLRKEYPFSGTPIRMRLRGKRD